MIILKNRRKKVFQTKLNAVKMYDIYREFREEYKDKNISFVQFRKVVNDLLSQYYDEVMKGKILNIGNSLGLIFVRKTNMSFKRPIIDRIESTKIKMEHYGCNTCEDMIQEDGKILPVCRVSGRNIFGTVCHKNPDLLKRHGTTTGIPWIVPRTEKYYYHLAWQKKYARVKNKRFYCIAIRKSFWKDLWNIKNKELIFNNR